MFRLFKSLVVKIGFTRSVAFMNSLTQTDLFTQSLITKAAESCAHPWAPFCYSAGIRAYCCILGRLFSLIKCFQVGRKIWFHFLRGKSGGPIALLFGEILLDFPINFRLSVID